MSFYVRRSVKFLVILDTMWGDDGVAPPWFYINTLNHSGRRLYKLTGAQFTEVLVTNACKEMVADAKLHGTPSSEWLTFALQLLPSSARRLPLLVCGTTAQATFAKVKYQHRGPIVTLPHPAARNWTRRKIASAQRRIRSLTLSRGGTP